MDESTEENLWERMVRERFAETLPEPYATPIRLFFAENWTLVQIAAHLDLSVPAVKVRIYRGRGRYHRWRQNSQE